MGPKFRHPGGGTGWFCACMSLVRCLCVLRRSLKHFVLDEADRLLEMGFVKQVDSILSVCLTESVQRCMYSATMPQGIAELASSVLRDPVTVTVGVKGAGMCANISIERFHMSVFGHDIMSFFCL